MIFVSFGNAPAEHSFVRLAEAVDNYAGSISEEVFVQVGHTKFDFLNCMFTPFLDHGQMLEKLKKASLVILHGGWGSISEALSYDKRIITVPRIAGKEHYHDQAELVRALEQIGCVIGVYEIRDLPTCIEKAKTFNFKKLKRGSSAAIINESLRKWFQK